MNELRRFSPISTFTSNNGPLAFHSTLFSVMRKKTSHRKIFYQFGLYMRVSWRFVLILFACSIVLLLFYIPILMAWASFTFNVCAAGFLGLGIVFNGTLPIIFILANSAQTRSNLPSNIWRKSCLSCFHNQSGLPLSDVKTSVCFSPCAARFLELYRYLSNRSLARMRSRREERPNLSAEE